jgi:hypothetical protein
VPKLHRPVLRSSCLSPLGVIFLTLLAVAQPVLAEPVKIMPFGTWAGGLNGYVSYRYDLWFKLTDAGFDVDFVGNRRDTGGSVDMDLYPEYLTAFDRDHQGAEAAFSSDMVGIATSVSAAHEPDIVLLWAGPFDLLRQGAGGVTNARFAIPDIIEGIRRYTPGVTILLAQCSHADPLEAAHVDALNDVIANIASEMDTPESPIIVVDQTTGFDPKGMMYDGHHHNSVGEQWVAQNWFEVLADILPASEPFQINAGHSGAWFNPDTSGQGVLIDAEPEEQFMFVSWFTYTDTATDNPNEQRWLTAQGKYSGKTAQLDLFETLGGRFDDPQAVTTNLIGEVSLSFSDCGQGQMTYSMVGEALQGEFPLQRVISGSGNVCAERSGASTQAVDINAGMDGAWFDPNTSGQGFFIDTHPDPAGGNFIFVSWFTYGEDTVSGQRWLTAQGGFEGSIAEIDVFETTGGSFDDPQAPSTNKVGTMSINFTDCSNAQLSYSLPAHSAEGDIAITRAIPGAQTLCEELNGAN